MAIVWRGNPDVVTFFGQLPKLRPRCKQAAIEKQMAQRGMATIDKCDIFELLAKLADRVDFDAAATVDHQLRLMQIDRRHNIGLRVHSNHFAREIMIVQQLQSVRDILVSVASMSKVQDVDRLGFR